MSFGLVSFGQTLGEPTPVADAVAEYTGDEERILGYGYRTMHRCPPEVGLTDLAVEAGAKALTASGTDPGELDLVVIAITDIVEYLYWDAAAKVAHRLGASRAEAVFLTQACTTGVMSLDTVAGKFATHPGYSTALVIAVNRTCEPYWNRMDVQPAVFSDGAVATVARRGHPALRWLATEVTTDGAYADFYRMEAGGAAAPFRPGGTVDPADLRVRDAWDLMEFFNYDGERFEAFVRMLDERGAETIRRACARVGADLNDVARFILPNDNVRAMTSMAAVLGVELARTNADLSAGYGHLGAADQLFCLAEYAATGALEPGTKVALFSMGRGMHWACSLLEV
ncbi:3-oxoacyl-ACP synthase III family protein [Plantactinospora sp. CA-290183]|uniref:3-oxoacyl-ACP synthase III family protein n=1 Tax=Plantactinospora sp. CA-290183 TaxID=3240006 RepID=UPI003D8CB2F5